MFYVVSTEAITVLFSLLHFEPHFKKLAFAGPKTLCKLKHVQLFLFLVENGV